MAIIFGGVADERKAQFGGAVVIRYTLTNAFGTSSMAIVTVNVTARPDPSADSTMRAISDAQADPHT